ncbi:uncharacterized protein GGS22DRAFT_169252 [Annulohypoxylon maeteangense]|uniref:uncharacterized protein n=1 Tax=Annulohypoxylon maeteangense TaxID=1927788 RepID=UPI0020073D39|nr:uncharacterized protein GGS22DRAFT_169252 [Annulohypoxylon maeteangense]KAI0883000.1 hypothetical protein GGS22DRAFT_169252 [Annulohypoxylon maeteangense]
MGCCFSRSAGPNAPYPGGSAASPSARAINSPPPLHPSTTDDSAPASRAVSRSHQPPQSPHTQQPLSHHHHHQHRIHGHHPPLSQHIDKPLRRHEWVARDRTWTRSQLDTEREDFFDTRVTGRAEVWQVLKATLEVLWEADQSLSNGEESRDGDGGSALATAQSILKAAEVTLPTGDLSNGVYDALGNYYALPEWIVCDPVNVAEESSVKKSKSDVRRKGDDDLTDEDDAVEEIDEDEALRRREEKGKGVADIKNMVKVRARLSENLPDVIVSVSPEETVRSFAKRVAEESRLPSTKYVRVAYMGKILKENMSLESQGWKKGHVVNALVFNR